LKRWLEFAGEAHREASGVIRPDIWDDQVEDVIEFYAAWVTQRGNYSDDRQKLMRLLAGRKNLRDFEPAKGRAGVPKSSLDGQRESVLRDGDRANWPRRLRLSKGEQLDVVGITKRLGKKIGESHPTYSSVARIAAETWLQGKREHQKFADFRTACGEVPGLNRVAEQAFGYFPFEGTVIFRDRHSDLVDELGPESKPKLEVVAKLLKELGGEPNPYLAVLVADGDKMGAAISTLASPEEHRIFSSTLAEFATEAKTIVEKHNGVLVYAGGDDVLAFLPVDKCLRCARKLHSDFGE
ncbi:MAG TPA: type III-B CRISPR-associated protein Cas10/Cmr2, partial [Lacipirellulaceae bacterium]|nr:type III-B CRISPR-associated protein Cas10/Cmr2 [Lacipirellulaceae bacterium]